MVTLAYQSAEASLVTHIGKEAFIVAVNDSKLQLQIIKREPQNVEAALSHVIRWEAIEQSLTYQGTLVNHNDGHTMHQPCTVCAVTGPSEVSETAALRELIDDLQNALAQATRGMAALAAGLWSAQDTPSDAASSVDSVPDTVLTLPAPACEHTASGQPGYGGGRGHGDHPHSMETDPCHIGGQVRQQADKSDRRRMESAIRSTTYHRILWSIRECQDDFHQHKYPR